MGNRYALLQVTNNGATCTLYGYSGLQLQTADGTVLPTNANQREVTEGIPAEPSVVTLQPSGSAVAYLHWIVGPCFTLGDDGTPATRPAAVTVTLPDETTGFTVPWTHGAVCGDSEGRNLIDIGPYRAA